MKLTGIKPTENGGVQVEITPEGDKESVEACRKLAEHFLHLLNNNQASNFIEMKLYNLKGESVIVTLQRVDGLTPNEKLQLVEKERDALKAQLEEIKKGK